ncbi:MAG: hypothetical protein LJF06_14790 [Gemmatimonadetes bacterium]|nr:hypothetical protein [Gemmatimonadota bacterium]
MRCAHRYLILLSFLLTACATTPTAPSVVGTWGGTSASLVLQPGGGRVMYLCGAGTIDAGWHVAPDGTLTATGEHYFGGGPMPVGGWTPHPATYVGHIDGDRMTLTVTVTDTNTTLGPFELVRNGPAVHEICV